MKFLLIFTMLLWAPLSSAQAVDLPGQVESNEGGYDDPCDPFYMGPELCFEPGGGGGGGDTECGGGSIPCGETYEFLPGSFSCPESNSICDTDYNIRQQGLQEGLRRLGCFDANNEFNKEYCQEGSVKNRWYRVNVTTTPSGTNYAVYFRITKYKNSGVNADTGIRRL